MHLVLYTLFNDHTCMFLSPSATILRVCSIMSKNEIKSTQHYTVHPVDGSGRRPKHVGVVNKQRI